MSSIFPAKLRVARGVLLEEPPELRGVEVRRLQVLVHERPVALLPVTEEVTVEVARPADAALEEAEVQRGEPLGDAAEEEAAGERVVALREVPEVVADEVRRQAPVGPPHRAAVAGDRDAEVDELLPHGVVVVGTVDAQRVDVHPTLGGVGLPLGVGLDGARDRAPRDQHLQPEPVGVVHLLDRLGRLGEAEHADRHHAVEVGREQVGDHRVVGADGDVAQLGVGDVAAQRETHAGEDDGEVDAPVVEAVVEEARERGGGAVAHVDRDAPVRRAAEPALPSLLDRELVPPVEAVPVARAELVDIGGAADLGDVVEVDREELDPVAIGVDHRVVELGAHLRALGRHDGNSSGRTPKHASNRSA